MPADRTPAKQVVVLVAPWGTMVLLESLLGCLPDVLIHDSRNLDGQPVVSWVIHPRSGSILKSFPLPIVPHPNIGFPLEYLVHDTPSPLTISLFLGSTFWACVPVGRSGDAEFRQLGSDCLDAHTVPDVPVEDHPDDLCFRLVDHQRSPSVCFGQFVPEWWAPTDDHVPSVHCAPSRSGGALGYL